MKANELRIGNWVKTCVPDMEVMIPYLDTQVQGIDIFGRPIFCHTPQREGFSMSPNHITGIPLTPEILEMAGFINIGTDDFHDSPLWKKDGCEYLYCEGGYMVDNSGYYGHYCDIGDAKYIHQLQNLYFALTGKEIEIHIRG